MNNDKIGSNEGKLKVRDLRSPILHVFFFRLIRTIKDILVEINLVCTPNPVYLSQHPLHSDISFSTFLCLFSILSFRTWSLEGRNFQHYIVLPHYSYNKTRKNISKHQLLTRTFFISIDIESPITGKTGVSTFSPVISKSGDSHLDERIRICWKIF